MLAYLHEYKKIEGPHLIIGPKSTISNWMKEFNKWTPFFRVVHLNPKMEFREEILKTQMVKDKFDVCLTSYEGIIICIEELKKHKW